MTISKARQPIRSLEDWYRLAPPKSRGHWVPGRSALELARAWLGDKIPAEVEAPFLSHRDFGAITEWRAEPEAKLRFDDHGGEPRNSDLVVEAVDRHGPYLIAVEGKADEPFGTTVEKTVIACRKRAVENPRSKGSVRVEGLVRWLMGPEQWGATEVGRLRYQLLTATAGAIRAAEEKRYPRAVLLIHEFVTSKTTPKNIQRNAADLDAFVRQLSKGAFAEIRAGQLLGPLAGLTTNRQSGVEFYIAKASRTI